MLGLSSNLVEDTGNKIQDKIEEIENTVCAIQFATKGIRYFGSLNTSRDSTNMLTTFSGHHSKVPDHLIQH